MYVLWLACDRQCLLCLLGGPLWALNSCQTLFSLFCWLSVSHCQPVNPALLQRELLVASSYLRGFAENFLLLCSTGGVGKRLFPTFAWVGGIGFEIVSFPLVLASHWDSVNLLKQRDRSQLGTGIRTIQWWPVQAQPTFQPEERALVLAAVANFSLKRESCHVFNG